MSRFVIHRIFDLRDTKRLQRYFNIAEHFMYDLNAWGKKTHERLWTHFVLMYLLEILSIKNSILMADVSNFLDRNPGHMSASDPKEHMTMCSANEDMRKRQLPIFHHIYNMHTAHKKEGEYMSFSASSGSKNRKKMSADRPVTKASVNDSSRLWTNSLFSERMTDNSAPVAYSFIMQSYYVLLRDLKPHKVTLIKDAAIGRYHFMHPELQRKTWAHFPMRVLTPTDARC